MDRIKAAVARNITALRTAAGITQLELAERLNYSDKAVSKWERGEALPDVVVLKQIGDIFGVTVNDLIDEKPIQQKKYKNLPAKTIMALAVTAVWTLAAILFIIGWLMDYFVWQVFVYAVPISLVTLLVLHSVWEKGKHNYLIVAGLTVASLGSLYCVFYQRNWWQLFLLIIPAQLIVWLAFRIKHRR